MDKFEGVKKHFLCNFVDIPEVEDERGSLCFAERKDLPFAVERIFWIYGVKSGKTRGGHTHRTCAEVIFPVHGSFEILVDNGYESQVFVMDSPHKGIYIAPNVWCHLRHFSPDAVCVVLASQAYDAEGYINDYETFKAQANGSDTLH